MEARAFDARLVSDGVRRSGEGGIISQAKVAAR
jgi:hypothetical protein